MAVVANEFACTANLGFGQGFNYFNGMFWNLADGFRWTTIGNTLSWELKKFPQYELLQPGRKKAVDVNRYFLNWIQKRSDRPFFAWLNYFDPHDPYFAPAPFNTRYGSIPADGQAGSFGNLGASDWGGILTPGETDWQIDHYDASIAYLDDQLGKLFAGLRQAGLYDNTIIVITSDHGEAFGEHQLYGHANSLYREEIQVPLIIRYPEKISSSEQVAGNVSLRDLAATVIDLADLKSPQPFPGQSFFNGSREAVIAELYQKSLST